MVLLTTIDNDTSEDVGKDGGDENNDIKKIDNKNLNQDC